MAYEAPDLELSYVAAADLSGNQFQGVVVTSGTPSQNTALMNAPAAGGRIDGVLQGKPKSGQSGAVMHDGVSKMRAGTGGITVGALVAVDNTGKAVIAATGNVIIGRCVVAAAATAIGSVLLMPTGAVAP